MRAAMLLPGTPRVSVGIMAAALSALLTDSAAAKLSRLPLPNFSGSLELRFASL